MLPGNDIADPHKVEEVCQDMSRPLSHYYIHASHRTYLATDSIEFPAR